MTIEYKDSKRIVKLAGDVVETATYETDFSSNTGSQTWTSTNSSFDVNTSDSAIIANNTQTTTNLQVGKDVGSLSNTAWVIDFDLKIVSKTSAGSLWTHIGMFNGDTSVDDDQSQNFLGLILHAQDNQGVNTNAILLADQQGGTLGNAGILTFGEDSLDGNPQFYLRMRRTDADTLILENYSSSARTGTASTTVTKTLGDDPQSLQYFKVSNRTVAGSGVLNIKIENLKIYNAITSLTNKPTNVQDMMRLT